MQLLLLASSFSAKPIVASVSTFRSIKSIPLFNTLFATSAPEEGVPVASITISGLISSMASIDFAMVTWLLFPLVYLAFAESNFSSFLSTTNRRSTPVILFN